MRRQATQISEDNVMGSVGVSVVICCYQSAERIADVLEALKCQVVDGVTWELILVDNNCSDQTAEVAVRCWSSEPTPLRIVSEPTPGLIFARQAGFKAAKYEYVAFLDDDNLPNQDWIQKVFEHFERYPDSGVVSGFNHLRTSITPPPWFEQVQHSWAVGAQAAESGAQTVSLWGAGMVVRRSAWRHLESNGFTPLCTGRRGASLSSGEDSELVVAIYLAGWATRYDESLKLTHCIPEERLNLEYARRLYRGFGAASVWLDSYWRAGAEPAGRLNKWRRFWFYQAIANLLATMLLALRPTTTKRGDPILQLQMAQHQGKFLELLRVKSEYETSQSAIENARWRNHDSMAALS